MIKWSARKLDVWLKAQTENFDLDDENINRVTARDTVAMWRIINSPMFNLVMIVFLVIMAPFIVLFELLQGFVYLVLIAAGVVFVLTSVQLLSGQISWGNSLAWIVSGIISLGYFVVYQILRRTDWYKTKRQSLKRSLRQSKLIGWLF